MIFLEFCSIHSSLSANSLNVRTRFWNSPISLGLSVVIVVGEAHLRRILGSYAAYYNESRIHRSLNKDAPFHRAIERFGAITSQPVLGGLHHQYCRI
jgi:hypothetical protein